MKAIQQIIGFLLIASLLGLNAGAATLSLEPAAQTVAPGAIFSVDIVISGLGNGTAASLGDFDIDLGFDPVEVSLVGISLDTNLGDIALIEAIDVGFGEVVPGTVNVAEVSFLSDVELDSLQPGTFVLATVEFMTVDLDPGASTQIGITVLSLGDVMGEPVGFDSLSGTVVTAMVTDSDGDGVPDDSDNCLDIDNSDQRDTDADNIGNPCDPDVNDPNDCFVNFLDLDIFAANFFQAGDFDTDLNGDGQTNFLDLQIVAAFFFLAPGPSAVGCN